MKVKLTARMVEELDALEVDTLEATSSIGHRAFVAAMSRSRRSKSGMTVDLRGTALEYAASQTGAFLNTEDILKDQGETALARAFKARWEQVSTQYDCDTCVWGRVVTTTMAEARAAHELSVMHREGWVD